jgi:glycogen debranching enzyme
MSDLAGRRGEQALAERWRNRADAMRIAIEARFWLPDLNFYALALDGAGNPCRVRASNAGHLLYTGVPSARRANQVIEQLLSACFDNGWGIRTLAAGEARFNPMSYHNGSVWPHDSALCAAGMARYGDRRSAVHVLNETFKAADHFGMRLPELFCGFARKSGEPPVGYPVACLPQAWSSGAAFMMLHACLGLHIDGWRNQIHVDRPELPAEIERLTLHGLALGDARVDLVFQRVGKRVIVTADTPVPERVRLLVRI